LPGWDTVTDQNARWAWVEVDLAAYAHNVKVMRNIANGAGVWVVVKANAYGHGAVPIAREAIAAGVDGLCVALVSEGVELRRAGIDSPVLIFSEQPEAEINDLVTHRLAATVYSARYIEILADAVRSNRAEPVEVHLKIDTGMHRIGAEPEDADRLVDLIARNNDALRLSGLYTHFAAADTPGHPANTTQSTRFNDVIAALGHKLEGVAVHAVNSAGAMSLPDQRRDFIRTGIATYGIIPGDGVADSCDELRPVMSLHARVSRVQRLAAGEGVSYGHRSVTRAPTTVATLPIGYADGVPRRLWSEGGVVLIGGKRRPIIGVITMDQLMVDCGDLAVEVGDRAVLLGSQGDEMIRAEEWARALDTIGYEITCGIGSRVPRVYTRSV
jgi:alanine racemase